MIDIFRLRKIVYYKLFILLLIVFAIFFIAKDIFLELRSSIYIESLIKNEKQKLHSTIDLIQNDEGELYRDFLQYKKIPLLSFIDGIKSLEIKYDNIISIDSNYTKSDDFILLKDRFDQNELNIRFNIVSFFDLMNLCQDILSIMPRGYYLVSNINIHSQNSLTPDIISNLIRKKSPMPIEVSMVIYIREINS